ncbi:MAG: hypothetical protein ABSG03_20735 [Bryobacteraceae bacterium]|jgi:hypothetical protein
MSFPEHSKNCGCGQDDGNAQLKYVGVAPKTHLLLVRQDSLLKGRRQNRPRCSAHLLKIVVRQRSIYLVPFDDSGDEEDVQTNKEDGNHDGANNWGISLELHVLAKRQAGESCQRRPQAQRNSPLEFPSLGETCPSHVTERLQLLEGRAGRNFVTRIRLHLGFGTLYPLDDTKDDGFSMTLSQEAGTYTSAAPMTLPVRAVRSSLV